MSTIFQLGSDKIVVNIDNFGQICSVFLPELGRNILPNQQTVHKIGIFIDGICLWLDDNSWSIDINYDSTNTVLQTKAINSQYQIRLSSQSVVNDGQMLRKLKLKDLSGQDRRLTVFAYQNFILGEGMISQDTAQIIDSGAAALHSNPDISAVARLELRLESGYQTANHYTVGLFGTHGLEGSWRDAEDGILSSSKVDQGQTDSTLGLDLDLSANGTRELHYSLVFDTVQSAAKEASQNLKGGQLEKQYIKSTSGAHKWLAKSDKFIKQIEPTLQSSFIRNLTLIKASIRGGAISDYTESNLSTTKNAIFSVWPLIRLGYKAESLKILERYINILSRDGLIQPSYTNTSQVVASKLPYFMIGSQEFPPISVEDSAAVLFMVNEYYQKFHDQDFIENNYKTAIKPLADFLNNSIDETGVLAVSYNLWNKQLESTTFACSLVSATLSSAALMAGKLRKVKDAANWRSAADRAKYHIQTEMWNEDQGYFYRSHKSEAGKDSRIDPASLYGAYMFGVLQYDSPQAVRALETLQSSLPNIYYTRSLAPIAEKHELLPSLWLAEIFIDRGQKDEAMGILNYVSHAIESNQNTSTWVRAEFISALLDIIS